MQAILHYSRITHRRTTAYHRQTNGVTEHLNNILVDMHSMCVDVKHKTWDEILPYLALAYNAAAQETTDMTPFAPVYGRETLTMLDAMLPYVQDDANSDVGMFLQRSEEARQLARFRIKAQQ